MPVGEAKGVIDLRSHVWDADRTSLEEQQKHDDADEQVVIAMAMEAGC